MCVMMPPASDCDYSCTAVIDCRGSAEWPRYQAHKVTMLIELCGTGSSGTRRAAIFGYTHTLPLHVTLTVKPRTDYSYMTGFSHLGYVLCVQNQIFLTAVVYSCIRYT